MGEEGIHFGTLAQATQRAEVAQSRQGRDSKKRVITAYVKASNPLVFDFDIGEWTPYKLAQLFEQKAKGETVRYWDSKNIDFVEVDGSNLNIELTEADLPAIERLKESDDFADVASFLQSKGFDSIRYRNTYEGTQNEESYILLSPEQIKSADPVTYDADGNVIPLSQRFDSTNEDIRYSDIDELDDLHAQLKEKQTQISVASAELREFDAETRQSNLFDVLNREGVSQQEIDAALQEYGIWGKESGYADAFDKLSALKDEEKLIRREIQKAEDRLHDELKEQIAHWSDEDVKKYVDKAVRKYHTTSRLENASYLLTTGSMLDFSDGHGYRVKDHREISEILDLPDYAEYSDGMIAFMNMGNIRLQTYGILRIIG
jgi:hypothetical protein